MRGVAPGDFAPTLVVESPTGLTHNVRKRRILGRQRDDCRETRSQPHDGRDSGDPRHDSFRQSSIIPVRGLGSGVRGVREWPTRLGGRRRAQPALNIALHRRGGQGQERYPAGCELRQDRRGLRHRRETGRRELREVQISETLPRLRRLLEEQGSRSTQSPSPGPTITTPPPRSPPCGWASMSIARNR